jgi:hypothetical protein
MLVVILELTYVFYYQRPFSNLFLDIPEINNVILVLNRITA